MTSKARTKIFPHLWYATEAEEAARFYASIFPDSRMERVSSLQSESPSGPPGSVKVVTDALLKMVKLDIAALEKAYHS
jgi:predicted 3-demethylubiquinone-9 3-methyltransferase (glyoxalase superfamily)